MVIPTKSLSIDFSPMSDSENPNDLLSIIDFVNGTVIADPDSPRVSGSGDLMTASGPWVLGEGSDAGNDSLGNIWGKRS